MTIPATKPVPASAPAARHIQPVWVKVDQANAAAHQPRSRKDDYCADRATD